jgi:hypothetical protein
MIATTLAAAAVACWMAAQPAMPFTTIAQGHQSQMEESREAVARTPAEWAALWKGHRTGKPPDVDFTRSMVIAVFLGTRPTAGFAVEITGIEKKGAEVIVTYRERSPGADELVAQVMTAPFHIVKTDQHAGSVRFERAR